MLNRFRVKNDHRLSARSNREGFLISQFNLVKSKGGYHDHYQLMDLIGQGGYRFDIVLLSRFRLI